MRGRVLALRARAAPARRVATRPERGAPPLGRMVREPARGDALDELSRDGPLCGGGARRGARVLALASGGALEHRSVSRDRRSARTRFLDPERPGLPGVSGASSAHPVWALWVGEVA